jgi:hypothetical protein
MPKAAEYLIFKPCLLLSSIELSGKLKFPNNFNIVADYLLFNIYEERVPFSILDSQAGFILRGLLLLRNSVIGVIGVNNGQ